MRLENIQQETDSFIDCFCQQLQELVPHDFISKRQANFLKNTKQNLADDEIIAILDFSENLSFEIQFEVQSAYYSRNQCTIHPICFYFKENSDLKHQSIIIIAESLQHTTEAVYLFQTKFVAHLKSIFGSEMKKTIKFFSDGAASQYKNRKNFLNLCSFKKDFGTKAEWHFFATAHGKSPCDALGGAFKRTVRNFNMKQTTDSLRTAKEVFDWTQSHYRDPKTTFIYCTKTEYDENYANLNSSRFNQNIKVIEGTRSFHSFQPIDESTISASILSDSTEKKTYKLI